MAEPTRAVSTGAEEHPTILLWLAEEARGDVRELLARDDILAARLIIYDPEMPIAGRHLVVLDESTLSQGLAAEGWVRRRGLPVVVLLGELTVDTISRMFGHHYLNIKGIFRRRRLAGDLVELGRLAQVLREECSLLVGEGNDSDHQRLREMIHADGQEGQTALTSLFVDAKMRRFLHELGQALDRAQATGIKEAGERLGVDGPAWQPLLGEIGRHLRGEAAPNNAPTSARRRGAADAGGGGGLMEALSDGSRQLLRSVRQKPAGLQGLHILIHGETGTGKTLIAHWIKQHLGVTRLQHINVTALAETLVETELFGSVRGGFTDATDRVGALLAAYGGVVFLDEIGDMPPALQSKLLVYLDSYAFRPVGWPAELGDLIAPCFVVAATNRPLEELIKRGEFREDLYHRFLYKLYLPPLRERKGDLPLLVDLVLQDERVNIGARISGVSYHTLRLLEGYPFKGNFRELEHILSRACALAAQDGKTLLLEKHIYRAILEIDGKLA